MSPSDRSLKEHRQSDGSQNYTSSLITKPFPLSAFSGKAPPAWQPGDQTPYIVLYPSQSHFIQVKRILPGSFFDPPSKFYDSFLWYIS